MNFAGTSVKCDRRHEQRGTSTQIVLHVSGHELFDDLPSNRGREVTTRDLPSVTVYGENRIATGYIHVCIKAGDLFMAHQLGESSLGQICRSGDVELLCAGFDRPASIQREIFSGTGLNCLMGLN